MVISAQNRSRSLLNFDFFNVIFRCPIVPPNELGSMISSPFTRTSESKSINLARNASGSHTTFSGFISR